METMVTGRRVSSLDFDQPSNMFTVTTQMTSWRHTEHAHCIINHLQVILSPTLEIIEPDGDTELKLSLKLRLDAVCVAPNDQRVPVPSAV